MSELEPHLLVVDDDARLRELLRRYLSENGFRVTVAAAASEARANLASFAFDLSGKVYAPVEVVGGSAASTTNGVYTVSVQAGWRISIDPANGRMPLNGRYVVTVINGTSQVSRITVDGTLTRVLIRGTTKAVVDNWTNIAVVYA